VNSPLKNIIFDIGNVLLEFRVSMYVERSMLPIEKSIIILEKLRKHYRLFAITDASIDQIRFAQGEFPFFAWFTDVITAEVGLRKNDPAIYRYCVKKHNLIPGECLYIDDREENVAAALASGLEAIVFTGADACIRALEARGVSLRP